MLSSALNFLTDRRKRIHRSDTLPAFAIENLPETSTENDEAREDSNTELTKENGLYSHSMNKINIADSDVERKHSSDCGVGLTDQSASNVSFVQTPPSFLAGALIHPLELVHHSTLLNKTDSSPSIQSLAINYKTSSSLSPHPLTPIDPTTPDQTVLNSGDSLYQSLDQTEFQLRRGDDPNVATRGERKALRTKTSLQRSKSSAQITHGRQPGDKSQFNNKSARSKKSLENTQLIQQALNTDVKKGNSDFHPLGNLRPRRDSSVDTNPERGGLEHKRRPRKRGKPWTDKGGRSKSVNSFRKLENLGSSTHQTDVTNLLRTLLNKRVGTSVQPSVIRAPDYMRRNDGFGLDHLDTRLHRESIEMDLAPVRSGGGEFCDLNSNSNNTSSPNQKLNRYAVVRRLRRNNSTLNWSSERSQGKRHIRGSSPTSQLAGDLLLPARTKRTIEPEQTQPFSQELANKLSSLYDFIKRDDVTGLLMRVEQFKSLSDELKLNKYERVYPADIGPLEWALLIGSPPLIAILMALDFQPVTVIDKASAEFTRLNITSDYMHKHLVSQLKASEDRECSLRGNFNELIDRANELNQACNRIPTGSDPGELDVDRTLLVNAAFAEVQLKEQELTTELTLRQTLVQLRNGLDRYPRITPPPAKVQLMVASETSIFIRISSPNDPSQQKRLLSREDCRSTSDESDTLEDNMSPSEPKEGRRVNVSTDDRYDDIILRYRVEWSFSKHFPLDQTWYCVFCPPIRMDLITRVNPESLIPTSVRRESFHRTGFLELTDFQRDQTVYIRVYALSIRGWSVPCYACPKGLKPTSWYEGRILQCASDASRGQLSESGDNEETLVPPNRYVGNKLNEELRAMKQVLDQQLLLWTYKPTTQTTGSHNETNNTAHVVSTEDAHPRRNRSPILQRKRSFRFPFTTKGMKFTRQTKSGLYLALLCYTVGRNKMDATDSLGAVQLFCIDDSLPLICVTREENVAGTSGSITSEINWFAKLIADCSVGPELQLVHEHMLRQSNVPTNLQLRLQLLASLQRIQLAIGTCNVGTLYPEVFREKRLFTDSNTVEESPSGHADDETMETGSTGAINQIPPSSASILVLVKNVSSTDEVACTGGGLKWCSVNKFLRQQKLPSELVARLIADTGERDKSVGGAMRSELTSLSPEFNMILQLESLIHYSKYTFNPIPPGLYVVYIQMQAHMDQQPTMIVMKSGSEPYMLPMERVRRRIHVTHEEWNTISQTPTDYDNHMESASISSLRRTRFGRKLFASIQHLTNKLHLSETEASDIRIYLTEIVRPSPRHAFILIFPPTDQVCLPPNTVTCPPPGCKWLSMAFVERNIGQTYDPIFQKRMYSLTALLNLLLPLSAFAQRQCLSVTDWTVGTDRTNMLQSIQQQLDVMYNDKRWLGDAIIAARDRKRAIHATLQFTQLGVNLGLIPDPEMEQKEVCGTRGRDRSVASDRDLSQTPVNGALDRDNILRIYADYPNELAPGTSVRVRVSRKSTAGDLIRLTVFKIAEKADQRKQQKGISVQMNGENMAQPLNQTYVLTVTVKQTMHFLADKIRPILLKPPWRHGRFGVQFCDDPPAKVSPVRMYFERSSSINPSNQPSYSTSPNSTLKRSDFKIDCVDGLHSVQSDRPIITTVPITAVRPTLESNKHPVEVNTTHVELMKPVM